MGFLSNLVDATPLLGTAKGLWHYARGEEKEGDEAMYQSTRTSTVIVGGIFGGPGGAIGAGLATDAAASALMKKERGLINSCKDIGEDIEASRSPVRSIASAGLQLGLDGMSGFTGAFGRVGNASKGAIGKTVQRGGEQVILKSVRISSAEAAKMVARKSSERGVAMAAQRALLASAHVGFTAAQTTEFEERERIEREWEEQERERRWRKRDAERRERDQREREQRERECRKERERREREWGEREWGEREWGEREWGEREWGEREWREREQREREWREREQREREREQRERQWREREQREREEQRERDQETERHQHTPKKQKECNKSEQRANSEKQKRETSGSSSGSSQPPQGNKDNNKKQKKKELISFETFMTLLRRILKVVYGNESEPFSRIFENLPRGQRDYLSKVLTPLMMSGTLEAVIELVIRLFKQHFHGDISFLNFLSLLEFVQTYVTDELLERNRISSGTETAKPKIKFKARQEKIISEIVSEKDIIEKLRKLFAELKTEIEAEIVAWNPVFPNFRDIFAAVYHYFKHRKLPHDGTILSVKEYYDWVKFFLEELKRTQKFIQLKESKDSSYVHEIFVPIFCRRFRIVLTLRNNSIVLSSAFVVDKMNADDQKKHAILVLGEILKVFFIASGLLFILNNVFYGPMLLLNTSLIVFNCIVFIVTLLFNTLLFFFACFIFILKVLLNILLIFICIWFLFFYLPE